MLIDAPDDLASRDYPLLMAFHGAGGTNDGWVGQLEHLVNFGELIGVYPQGHDGYWALGPEPSSADGVAFVGLILDQLRSQEGVDGSRLYALGSSNGAGMAHRAAIEADHFQAFVALPTDLQGGLLDFAWEFLKTH